MDPITMMLIGSAVGLGKSALIDKPKEDSERKLAAETQRYSPWTGLKANAITKADPFGSALKYGATGAQIGNSLSNDEAAREALLNGSGKSTLNAGGNPWGLSLGAKDYLAGY